MGGWPIACLRVFLFDGLKVDVHDWQIECV